uniref:ST8 alpha-N-acetyl-neuraminide alpha-2,8-sialyltransferase 7.1 n=1 Tax=Sinocyclocheilus rhinocerous TaxID=307959 RepID=A0A673JUY9_9TELE
MWKYLHNAAQILLHQIHKIMIFKKASYDPFKIIHIFTDSARGSQTFACHFELLIQQFLNYLYFFRLNLAPVNGSDVGVKTDLVTINPSQNMAVNPGPLVRRVSVYGNASLMIPAFAYTVCTAVSIKTLQVLQPIRPQQPVVFFSPYYLKTLDRFWKGLGLKEKRLSTGFMLVNMALELFDDVHLYGFWPFDINLKQQTLQHHYYDNKPPKPFVHAMPEEFVHLLQLHSQGALTLHLQPCL